MKVIFTLKYDFVKRLVFMLTFCIVICNIINGQSLSKKDSVFIRLKTEKHDTVKLGLYYKLRIIYNNEGKPDSGLLYINKAIDLSRKIKHGFYLAFSLNHKGYYLEKIGERDSALAIFKANSELTPNSRNHGEILSALSHIGDYYYDKGDFNICLVNHQKYLTLATKFQDSLRLIGANINIGNIYLELKRPTFALEYFKKSLNYVNAGTTDFRFCQIYFSISSAFADMAKNERNGHFSDSARFYVGRSLKLAHKIEDYFMIANDYAILGNIFFDKGNYDSSIVYYNKSIKLRKEQELDIYIPEMINLSCSYSNIGDFKKATEIGEDIIYHYKKDLDYTDFAEVYDVLSVSANRMKNYSEAYKFMRLAKLYTDSVFSESASEKRKELEMNFEFDKKQEIQKAEQEKKDIIVDQEKKQQRQQRNYLIIGLIIVAFFSTLIFRGLTKQRAANKLIAAQKQEVEKQKELVEEHQKEVLDSIHYAKRIQNTLLAHQDFVDENLPNNFILFKPKDIVSGDFYWATKHGNNFYIAICDSTGHGVPGAFMSLLNIGFLSEAINEKNILEPHEIFNHVRERLITSISKEGQKDGFDGILLCVNQLTREVSYVAANNSPILISNNQLIELDKDRMPVGKGEKIESFKLQKLVVAKGDILYLYTDGYADQFGGPKGKKFKYKPLNESLLAISKENVGRQKEILEQRFTDWKGNLEQVDDVCILGIKF